MERDIAGTRALQGCGQIVPMSRTAGRESGALPSSCACRQTCSPSHASCQCDTPSLCFHPLCPGMVILPGGQDTSYAHADCGLIARAVSHFRLAALACVVRLKFFSALRRCSSRSESLSGFRPDPSLEFGDSSCQSLGGRRMRAPVRENATPVEARRLEHVWLQGVLLASLAGCSVPKRGTIRAGAPDAC